jgi:nitroreductase
MKANPFSRPVADLVRARRSCRSFAAAAPEPGALSDIQSCAAGAAAPFGGRPRFGLLDNETVRAENLFSAGSYGMIKGARFYLAVLVPRSEPRRWEDAGFAMEAAVLRATDLGLGSCWIGGVFDRKRFGRALGIGPGEQLPAVVALGLPAERRTLRDRLVRWSAGGDRRKPGCELFFAGGWGTALASEDAGAWVEPLECLRLAPSASNKQPWRLVRRENAFHFFLSRDKAYSAMMPLADLQRIDMGIAMCHFELAALEQGLAGKWSLADPRIPATPPNYEYIASYSETQTN